MVASALRDLLVRPEQFYENRSPDALLPYAVAAVLLTVGVTAVGYWLVGTVVAASATPTYGRLVGDAVRRSALVAPAAALLGWLVVAGLVHLLVRKRAADATFGRTFAVVAPAAVLEVPVILLEQAALYVRLGDARLDSPDALVGATDVAPYVLVAWIVVTLWKGYVWREGLRGAYDVDRVRATNAAGAAVVLSLLAVVLGV